MRQVGFAAYVAMCFLVMLFCMGMIILNTLYSHGDNNAYYAIISFILGKFTMLVVDKLVRQQVQANNNNNNVPSHEST
jgi:uncharacterized protein YhhL (DUF1145 family)